MAEKIKEYLDYLSIEKGYSQGTVNAYAYDVNKFLSFLPKESQSDITKQHAINYFNFLANKGYRKRNDKTTRARRLSSINSYFRFLLKEDYIKTNPIEGIKAPKLDKKEPSYLSEAEYLGLLKAIGTHATSYYSLRDFAIIKLFLTTGLRLAELTGMDISDVNLKDNAIQIIRKGRKEQTLPINQETAKAIKMYLGSRKDKSEALFISRKKSRISKGAVTYLVKKYMKKAGICNKKLSPHTLRHSFCTALLNKGVNIAVIQELAGHSSMDTTRRYIHLNNSDLREAINQLKTD